MKKIRMFGAGITNNIVFGSACFLIMILLMGTVVPISGPIVGGIYQDYSADQAGLPAWSVIQAVNGTQVETPADVSMLLNATRPGDRLVLTVLYENQVRDYTLNLSSWPEGTQRTTGFMGITYYDPALVLEAVGQSVSPVGFLRFLTVPFDIAGFANPLRVLALETPATQFYIAPFAGFWGIVHFLFWSGWINISVGVFNAIPMVPLDGGYILKEGVDRAFERKGWLKYAPYLTTLVSVLMIVILTSLILLPYLFAATQGI